MFFVVTSGVRDCKQKGDVVLIQDGVYHRVHANANGLEFICVFDGQRYDHVAHLGYD